MPVSRVHERGCGGDGAAGDQSPQPPAKARLRALCLVFFPAEHVHMCCVEGAQEQVRWWCRSRGASTLTFH
eukprot:680517-Pelagomonas_calceolata.AAC.1